MERIYVNISASCSGGHFDCGNGFCVDRDVLCNGRDDCQNAWDEIKACGLYCSCSLPYSVIANHPWMCFMYANQMVTSDPTSRSADVVLPFASLLRRVYRVAVMAKMLPWFPHTTHINNYGIIYRYKRRGTFHPITKNPTRVVNFYDIFSLVNKSWHIFQVSWCQIHAKNWLRYFI